MKNTLLFRAKSIGLSTRGGRKPSSLINAARHNLREIQAERGARSHIHAHLTVNNLIMHGPATSTAVVKLAAELVQRYAVPRCKFRRDHVQAIEFLISLPASTGVDLSTYFKSSADWLINTFGAEMVLSVVVHHDEETPHLHALVLPMKDGQYQGGALINRTRLPGLVQGFANDVGVKFGLCFVPKPRLSSIQRINLFQLAADALRTSSDPVLLSRLWGVVEGLIKRNPLDFLDALGLKMTLPPPSKKLRTLTQVMTSTGKKTREDRVPNSSIVPSCVGFRRPVGRNPGTRCSK